MIGIMDSLSELEGFEPQIRARSNTWPLPRPENGLDVEIKQENVDPNELGEYSLILKNRIITKDFFHEDFFKFFTYQILDLTLRLQIQEACRAAIPF